MVGDVGGTNCRFALVDPSSDHPLLDGTEAFEIDAFPTLEAAIDRFLDGRRAEEAVIAVAGPVDDGRAALTNGHWDMSEAALKDQGFQVARLLNDYEALALAIPRLTTEDLGDLGGPAEGEPNGTIAILGAGTGLGVGALVRNGPSTAVAVTEGGHMAFAPTDELEIEILRRLTARFGRASLERILSGPGLVNLYDALADIRDQKPEPLDPEDIAKRADAGDGLAQEVLDRFFRIYGAAAGDYALTFGAVGGVYLGGGIAPKMLDRLQASGFREAFEAKGRFAAYVAAIPTRVILHKYAALLGAGAAPLNG
ncbi:glucokinase [Caulobacter sp. SLTY]|uniref:glucokinase n=1 Tax=Caulobacter sp. SLTY TaxID=2683262 RepID=UPI00196B85D5|nr:glucokinase [Caulobacter sp. SLTY]